MAADLFVDNDNLIRIRNVVDALTGDAVADLEGVVTLYDAADAELTNATDMPISYAADAPIPFYYAEVPATVQLAEGTPYKVVFIGSNYGIMLEKIFTAKKRTG